MKKCLCVLLVLALLAGLGLTVGRTPIYNLYREIEYRRSTPTEAEQTVHAYAEAHKIPYGSYPKDLIELLEINPETRDFVLNYPTRLEIPVDLSGYSRETVPLFLQWDPHVGLREIRQRLHWSDRLPAPTCLAMVGYYLTGEESFNPKDVAAFSGKNGYYASGYGSSWTLISEGGVKLGLKVQELPLVKGKMTAAVEAGHPVILALGKGDFTSSGHYIVLTGWNGEAFRVNDPNSPIRSGRLWSYEELEPQIRNIWELSA